MKSPIKWAGGKAWLLPHLEKHFPWIRERRIVEPFAGGAAFSLGIEPKRALLNDKCLPLMEFWSAVKQGHDLVLPEAENTKESYLEERHRFNDRRRSYLNASLQFYYLNRHCFNGLYRENSKGESNVPFGKYDNPQYGFDVAPYAKLMEEWQIMSEDFETVHMRIDDFVFSDPPYDEGYTGYVAGGFSWADQLRLAHWLAERPGPVLTTNRVTDRILDLYTSHGFQIEILPAPRRISCDGDRSPVNEMLAYRGFPASLKLFNK